MHRPARYEPSEAAGGRLCDDWAWSPPPVRTSLRRLVSVTRVGPRFGSKRVRKLRTWVFVVSEA
jgi:hypothetical protein